MSAKSSQHFNDLKYLTEATNWPYWPVCPVIRREKNEKKLGMVLVHDNGYTVYECNMFLYICDRINLETVPSHDYSSAKAVVEDRWEVD